jgi:D-lyxose ketol-isomerase
VKRSEVDGAIEQARSCFERNGWALPPRPEWDVTDFGLGDFARFGLVLVNLAEEPEYCEKLMYARAGMTTPCHRHFKKKEDIICRSGEFRIRLWSKKPNPADVAARDTLRRDDARFTVQINRALRDVMPGETLTLTAGERITLEPGTFHEFWAASAECILGEVSTANDDEHDNDFVDPNVGRFPDISDGEA